MNILTEFIFQKFNTIKSVDTDIVKQQKVGSKILNVINKLKKFICSQFIITVYKAQKHMVKK